MNFIKKPINSRFLIIARVGDNSLHKEWLTPIENKNFDLCISYFGDYPERFRNDCDYYYESKGTKWPKIKEVIENLGEKVIEQYDAIWFPDDDIMTTSTNINKMFNIFIEQGFDLAQPALTQNSYFSHKVTIEQPDYLWRYSEFVEIMVPILSKNALKQLWQTFDICPSGWGLDLLWPKLLGYPRKKIAVIDDTAVQHTRPVGTGSLYNDLTPLDELHDLERKYDVDWHTYQSRHYDGVLKSRRLFILLLAHENEHVLKAQIDNIKFFNPDVGIILYNGGENKNFAVDLNVPICPYSQRIHWAASARVLWDVMRWLQDTKVDYEYLVSFDHDMLFVKHGFEQFLDSSMKELDCMGWQLLKGSDIPKYPDPRVAESLWREWHIWQPIFEINNFLRVFNPGQVYRKEIITKMLKFLKTKFRQRELDELFNTSKVYGFEEMFSVTLSLASGGKCGQYPDSEVYNEAVRWGDNITINEVQQVIKHPSYYWIHPIKYDKLIEMHHWLLYYYK